MASANGIGISYQIRGTGPPLLLIMGYRLSSDAWPQEMLEALSRHFTVISFDNRGTGRSDKPVGGYAIANLALDARCLLDHLGIERAHVLGYSMGGAVAQEFVRQFPDRTRRLVLCATMCGGALATYAPPRVQRVMRDLDGLDPEKAARQIWSVTYSPHYLIQNRAKAERQMKREIEHPTPLHAADLQFQAFAEFDCSAALSNVRAPTLVIAGDLDELIPPRNASVLAELIPHAKLIVLPGVGHRIFWEQTEIVVAAIVSFIGSPSAETAAVKARRDLGSAAWPYFSAPQFGPELVRGFSYSAFRLLNVGFGDGKPLILVPNLLAPEILLLSLATWLKSIGYRAIVARSASKKAIGDAIDEASKKLKRKVVLVAFDGAAQQAYDLVLASEGRVSDLVVIGSFVRLKPIPAFRLHHIRWITPSFVLVLSRLLRQIEPELLDEETRL